MSQVKYEAVRGTTDVLPNQTYKWRYVEKIATDVANNYGFKEIRFPTFEKTELFKRSVGDTTDVVQKEMYTFQTKGEQSITLRPEGTASVARVCLENGLFSGLMPLKMFYLISCFRYEKPQAGRYREFHQFGAELYGTKSPIADCEVICLAESFLKSLKIDGYILKINSIGCPKCRNAFFDELRNYFEDKKEKLCDTCKSRLERNPMRILDCKSPICKEISKNAPIITDYLCDECKSHFDTFMQSLDNLKILYEIDHSIVRGLDYYTKTVFEFVDTDTGLTLLAGGRYDELITELDSGKEVAGLGFAAGLERLILVMEKKGLGFGAEKDCELFLGSIGEKGKQKAALIAKQMRENGYWVELDICDRSVKSQMKYADKIGAKYTMILGDNEVENECADLKNMENGELRRIQLNDIKEI